jgi:hypothetical protein
MCLEVVIRRKAALPLHEAKAARVDIGECAELEITRIIERPPKLFALAGPYQQSIGIVDRRPVIVDAEAIVAVEVEHTCQGRDSGLGNMGAGIQGRFDVKCSRLARPNGEAEGTGGALTVQKRIHHNGIDTGMRPLDPEAFEDGKLLPGRLRSGDSKAARR